MTQVMITKPSVEYPLRRLYTGDWFHYKDKLLIKTDENNDGQVACLNVKDGILLSMSFGLIVTL